DRDLDVHVSEILAPEAHVHVQGFGRWLSQLIQPYLAVKAAAVADPRVVFPFTPQIAHPRWRDIIAGHEFTPVHEYLPPQIEGFVDEHGISRCLNDPPWRRRN